MNVQQLIAATAIALVASSGAIAQEATQFEVPPSTLSRAQVKAELADAIANGRYAQAGVVSETVQPAASQRSRHLGE
jgi:hypothetical protein